jgi:hypothetical protein
VDAAGGGRLDYGHVSTTLAFGKSGTSDTLTISGTFGAVTVGQPPLGVLSLVLTRGGVGTTALALNSTNVNNMLQAGTTYTGSFFQRTLGSATPIATAQFSGTIPVPEPGSIGLLAGLGLVCGRRVWRRRQQKQAAAAV